MKLKKVVKGLEKVEEKTQKRAEKMSEGRDAAVKLQKKKFSSGLELAPMSREDLDKPSKEAHKKGMKASELKKKIKKKYKIKRGPSSASQKSDKGENAYKPASRKLAKMYKAGKDSDDGTHEGLLSIRLIQRAGDALGDKLGTSVDKSMGLLPLKDRIDKPDRKKKLKIKKAK